MRQVPRTRKMPAARPITHILSGELGARSAVEYVCVATKLTLEDLPIDQTNRTRTGDRAETAC